VVVLITRKQVSKLLGVAPDTVDAWRRRGLLPHHRLGGGTIRYSRDDIEAYLAASRIEARL
jgi:excisionase family DNA binding protein